MDRFRCLGKGDGWKGSKAMEMGHAWEGGRVDLGLI
jgi:hypothetical protein